MSECVSETVCEKTASVWLGLISLTLVGFMLYMPGGYPQTQKEEEFVVAGLKFSPGVILFVSALNN